jgi:hypothetical protein
LVISQQRTPRRGAALETKPVAAQKKSTEQHHSG